MEAPLMMLIALAYGFCREDYYFQKGILVVVILRKLKGKK